MKSAKVLRRILIMGALAVTLVVTILSFTFAWLQSGISRPYVFDIYANGVLYVYIESEVVDNAEALYPAVAIPGAVEAGLPIDVLKAYDSLDADPSYVSRTASITEICGLFNVFNEGFVYEPVLLPKDEDGYTLYPKIDEDGKVVWNDPTDHSKGWVQKRACIEYGSEEEYVNGEKEWKRTDDHEPLIRDDGSVVWLITEDIDYDIEYYWGDDYWKCKQVPKEGSSECTVHISVRFKASDDPEVDDYFDSSNFVVKRLYLTEEDEKIPENVGLGVTYGNSGIPFDSVSADNTTAQFNMFGSGSYYIHAEVYLSQPDELLDREILGKDIYMTVSVAVEVAQF